ncbi:MAG: hypothetical protein HQM07_09700 [Zetaproteobacteria bacterium]|nr:hypothetical protein [Zetaproteobacteria bacterium]
MMQLMLGVFALLYAPMAWAVDSYRYLHVTIETPWMIFIFLFFMVFAPMILAVVLYWRSAMKKDEEGNRPDA